MNYLNTLAWFLIIVAELVFFAILANFGLLLLYSTIVICGILVVLFKNKGDKWL